MKKRIVLPGLAMIAVTYGLGRFAYGLLLPEISSTLDMNPQISGITGSGSYFAYCIAIVLSVLLIPKLGPLPSIVAAGISAFAGMLLIALSTNQIMLAAGVLIAGASTGFGSPAYGEVVTKKIGKPFQDQANTWINAGTGFGVMVSGPIVLLLSGHWQTVYFLFAFTALAVLIWNFVNIPRVQKDEEENQIKFSFHKADFKKSFFLIVASIILGISTAIYWTFSKDFITNEGNLSSLMTSIFWILIGLSGIAGGVAGNVIEKLGLVKAYRFTVMVIFFSLVILALFHTEVIPVYISALFFGSSYIFLTGVLLVWGIRLFPQQSSLGIGLPFLALAFGQIIGSATAGLFIQWTNYMSAFITFGLIGLSVIFIRPTGTVEN
ncbi:MFS transporter [Sporosarcina sp. D27]|uniref:MFS transporter n=1 Tax=Sporosarcina sp. D27 TaxID=1382305 RepID=UPI00046F3A37|nr:MFS transporter [Sporosarcina sp. D27]